MDFQYTIYDFESTPEPYDFLFKIRKESQFQHERTFNELDEYAKSIGFKNFKKYYKAYISDLTGKTKKDLVILDNVTYFDNQPMQLNCGDWRAEEYGIARQVGEFEQIACVHPIMPIERIVNIDTGITKLRIAFSRNGRWKDIIVDRSTLASQQKIISLADNDVGVNSENARALIQFIHDIEHLNYDILPERKGVSRLGYIKGEGFSPYVDNLVFDAQASFRSIFDAIKQKGEYEEWINIAKEVRLGSVPARAMLAASFASCLVEIIGGSPFFVHLWGGKAGSGKSVSLMLAASVWADPEMGKFIQTFNSTVVGREKLAGFLNNLPLMIDELQLAKDSKGKVIFNVYELAEGVGRTRGNKNGGVDITPTWKNCIMSTGETPIVAENAGAGAFLRVLELDCSGLDYVVEDGHRISNILRKNYGHAGREFVEYAYENAEDIREIFKMSMKTLMNAGASDKQAMAGAIVWTADRVATHLIFQDDNNLSESDILKLLKTESDVSVERRAYESICDWVSQNKAKFSNNEYSEVFGMFNDQNEVYIIRGVFNKFLSESGYSAKVILKWLKDNKKITTGKNKMTVSKRINNVVTECVLLKLPLEQTEAGDIPF